MSVTTMESRLTGKHILLILLGFFAIVGVVNAAFIYFALSTGPGEEQSASYEVGLRYNRILAEERTQNALQWHHQSQFAQGSRLRVSVTDNAGAPVPGLAVTGTLGRPATVNADGASSSRKSTPDSMKRRSARLSQEAGSCPS